MRPDNPVRGVERHADGRRDRRASADEYAALGEALRTMPETVWPIAVAAAHFLCVTGWRRGEMLALKWSEVDLATRTAGLEDTKTGKSMRPLSHAACEILRNLPRMRGLVFPASRGDDQPMAGFHKVWIAIARRAALPADVTPHVLRHSFASVASDLGYTRIVDRRDDRTQARLDHVEQTVRKLQELSIKWRKERAGRNFSRFRPLAV